MNTTLLKMVRGITSTALIAGSLLTQHVMRVQTADIKLADLRRNEVDITGHEAAGSEPLLSVMRTGSLLRSIHGVVGASR